MTTITRDEWLSEFERIMRQQPKGDPGLSTEELAEMLGVGQHRVNKLLRVAFRQGRLRAGKKPGQALDGRRVMVPCYQMVPKPDAKAAKKR
jgi:hypothetical protein